MAGATLGDLLQLRATDKATSPFLRMRGVELTFGEFNRECNRVAHGLRRLLVEAGEMVSVMLPNSSEFMFVWLALAKLGAVEAPINTSLRGPGLAHVLNLTGSRLLVIDDEYLDPLEGVFDSLQSLKTVVVRGDAARAANRFPGVEVLPYPDLLSDRDDDFEIPVTEADLAMLLFTSGTTGRSKGCMLSHRYVMRQGQLLAEQFRFRPDDVLYCPFPLFHTDATSLTVAPALHLGATAALGERFSVSRFWDEVRSFEATIFDFMGATLTMLWKQPPSQDDAENPVRLAWGVPMPEWASEFEERFDLQLVELYGLTDAGVVIFQPIDKARRPGSCGVAVPPYDVRVFDELGWEVKPREVGEIVIRPTEPFVIMDGYHNMPQETLEAFRNLWFHTGDLAYRDEDGWFYFVGRKKEAIRRRGENISSFEIEEIIMGHPVVREAVAIGVPSELTEEDVKVCVVLQPDASLPPEELVAYCEERMARFMVPRYIEFLDELPKTPTEKVEKYRLREAGITPTTWDREAAG